MVPSMAFLNHYTYAQYIDGSAAPDPDRRPLSARIQDAFRNNNADMLAVTITLRRAPFVSLDIELTDNPPPARVFPFAHEERNAKGASCAAVAGFILTRRDIDEKKQDVAAFDTLIKNAPLFAVL